MADRDENVYKAKLAEQAERYDGKQLSVCWLSHYDCILPERFADKYFYCFLYAFSH